MDIGRFLPTDQYDAAIDANSPDSANPFATMADLSGLGDNWANANLSLTGNRVHDFDGNSITENNVAEYDTNIESAGNRKILWDNGAGVTIASGAGANPAGFTGDGASTTYMNTPAGTKAWGGVWNNSGNAQITYSVYDPAFSTDEAGFIAQQVSGGGNSTIASIYHFEYASGDQTGFQADYIGERIISQTTGLNRVSALGASNGLAFLTGAGLTGYIRVADQDGFVDWMDNYFTDGWGGIYANDGTITANRTLDGDDLNLTFENINFFTVDVNARVAIAAGDPATFAGGLSILESPISAVNLTGNNTTSGQGGSFIIRESAGDMFVSIGLSDGVQQQAFILNQNSGTSYTNTKDGFTQPYTFSYQPATLGTQFRSYMAHYDTNGITTSASGNDVMGMTYLDTIGAGADFREFHMYLDPTAENLELIAWDNPNSHEGAIRIGYQSIVASSTDIGSITLDSNGLILDTDSALGFRIPTNADPDTNITSPVNGMIGYDSTDHDVRAYINGSWSSIAVNSGETYTPTNVITSRSFDADTVTLADLADIVGTIIEDFQAVNQFG